MPIGTFIYTGTAEITSLASTTLTHGLATTPHLVWLQERATSAASIASAGPAWTGVAFGSASVSVYNKGPIAATYTVAAAFFHSEIR